MNMPCPWARLSGTLVPRIVELSRRLEESSIARVEFLRNPVVIWSNFLVGRRGVRLVVGYRIAAISCIFCPLSSRLMFR